jgi:hypothetical protein
MILTLDPAFKNPDGTPQTIEVGDEKDPNVLNHIKDQAENAAGMQMAAQGNQPVSVGDKTFSATGAYNNNTGGNLAAWFDHNLGGNWLNRNVAPSVEPVQQKLSSAVSVPTETAGAAASTGAHAVGAALYPYTSKIGDWAREQAGQPESPLNKIARKVDVWTGFEPSQDTIANTVARGLVEGYTATPDLGIQGVNVARHMAGQTPDTDIPTLESKALSQANIPETPENNPYWRNILQNVVSVAPAAVTPWASGEVGVGANLLKNVAKPVIASQAVGYLANQAQDLFGEPAGYLTQLLGPATGAAKNFATSKFGKSIASPVAEPLAQAGQESNIHVPARAMMNDIGKNMLSTLEGMSLAGSKVRASTEAGIEGLQNAVKQSAEAVAGHVMPSNLGPESLGGTIVTGAQNRVLDAKNEERQAWDPVNRIMETPDPRTGQPQTVNAQPVADKMEDLVGANKTIPAIADPVRNYVNTNVTDIAPGGPGYSPLRGPTIQNLPTYQGQQAAGTVGPTSPAPSAEIPYTALKDFQTNMTQAMESGNRVFSKKIADPLKDTANEQIGQRLGELGQPPELYAQARKTSAETNELLDKLYPIAGTPVGYDASGLPQFARAGGEKAGFNELNRNMKSPSDIQATIGTFRPEDQRSIYGQRIGMMGYNKEDRFRPELVNTHWEGETGDKVQTHLTTDPATQAPAMVTLPDGTQIPAEKHMDNAAFIARNFARAPERGGTQGSLGGLIMMHHGLEAVDRLTRALAGSGAIGTAAGTAAQYATLKLASSLFESPRMKSIMAGAGPSMLSDIQRYLPSAGRAGYYFGNNPQPQQQQQP